MINGWTVLAALVLLGVGAAIGFMTAALLVTRRDDTEDDTEDGDD